MTRGWYHSIENGRRLLAIDDIAEACCVPSQEVKKWLTDKIQKPEPAGPECIDAAEVVRFLVKNSKPVATSLLPPKTKKILFIADNEREFQNKSEKFEQICHFLAINNNILVETAAAGKSADLSLLTFSPNLVVIFITSCSQEAINTCNLLTNFPEQKMILFLDDSIKSDVLRDLGKITASHLIVSDALSVAQLLPLLRQVFEN